MTSSGLHWSHSRSYQDFIGESNENKKNNGYIDEKGTFGLYIEAFPEGDVEVWLQILMNVVMFVPIGLLVPCCFQKFEKNKRIFLTALICSSEIELLQGILKIGMLETDDVLGNVLGAEIRFLIWWVSRKGKNDENG